MKKKAFTIPRLFVALLLHLFPVFGNAFTILDPSIVKDTVDTSFTSKMERFFKESSQSSINDLENDKAVIRQNHVIEEIKSLSQQAKLFLKKGLDTTQLRTSLREKSMLNDIARDGIFENKGSSQTARNLTTSYHLLYALRKETLSYKRKVDNYQEQLVYFRFRIDSLSNDKSLFTFPTDSADLRQYVHKLKVVAVEVVPINQQIKLAINTTQVLQNEINLELLKLENGIEEILYYQQQIAEQTFYQEFPKLWEKSTSNRPFNEILDFSVAKARLVFIYYIKGQLGKLLILLVTIGLVIFYVYSLRAGVASNDKAALKNSMLLRDPLLSGFVIAISVIQFLFPNPPFIVSTLVLLSSSIIISILFRHFISTYWRTIWLFLVILYIITATDNLILQTSRPERWGLIYISFLTFLLGTFTLFNKKKHDELRETWILIPIAIMTIMAFASLMFNVFGRFNIAKVLLISGLINVIAAIVFLWVLRLVNEGLMHASSLYKNQERNFFYINYNRVGQRAPLFFYALLIIGWFVLVGRNFYEFKLISDPLREFFYLEHTIGNYTFSLYSLIIFFLIMVVATVLSKVISYFASDPQWNTKDEKRLRKFHLGSWILLIRISIIVLGLFLAFAAVGIPVQQITLIIGALGVGIGFGLQALVNNFVSGLIIAFEKPVNVDDMIEVGNQSGKVKSVGFRSSIISTADGADLIIPNGDLLNSHVLNWTMGGFRKRLHIGIDLQYGTNLDIAKNLILEVLDKDEQILAAPIPLVQFCAISAQSVSVEIYFWVKNHKDAGQIKSDAIRNIQEIYQKKNIPLAVPRQEIYLHDDQSQLSP